MERPDRVLDAFRPDAGGCCAGGAGMGYHLAGFEVTGVDIAPQPNYPFRFVQGDAIAYIREHGHEFDLISAGPPCQYDCMLTAGTNAALRDRTRTCLNPTREALESTGRPHIIEHRPGERRNGCDDVTLCGEMFGLRVLRHRNFETRSAGRCPSPNT